ncbi:MAG: proteasome subunit beta [Actinobacteria bacterium]|nr:MAG: proteasome subunit beta [Actinomycetota bacterium]
MTDPSRGTSQPPGLQGIPGSAYPMGANPSFADLLRATAPGMDPRTASLPGDAGPATQPMIPHGTTVLAIKFADGVVMAGDRRAVEGWNIADERIDKVFPADETSAVAIAGAAGQATEIVRLFQTELEHYEKVEGDRLSLEGKANRLAQMIRQNFPMALQGLVVVPLFAGFDDRRGEGRLFRYDATGGRWEEADFHATGSGSLPARSTLKKRWRPGMDRSAAIRASVEALYDASQEDVATGGPNPLRGIFPTVKTITAQGVVAVPEDEVREAFEAVVGELREALRPKGGSRAREGSAKAEASQDER